MKKYLFSIIIILNVSLTFCQSKHAETIDGATFNMVAVEYGTFQMGNPNGLTDEKPVHSVTLNGFYMMDTEVTQGQWKAIMGDNPSRRKGDDLPVEQVNWDAVQTFISKLNTKSGKTYRLPTEAEWEYAARGGIKSKGFKYAGSNNIDDVAWYNENSSGTTHKVATKQPNELGLYDMSGNVNEWCNDIFMPNYYAISPLNNPEGAFLGTHRVIRGGCFNLPSDFSRTTRRGLTSQNKTYDDKYIFYIGFRLVHSR